MKADEPKSRDDLKMECLCRDVKEFENQRQKARMAEVNNGINIKNLGSLITRSMTVIGELERKGIKKPIVKDNGAEEEGEVPAAS